jgi:hypothetical protein
MSEEQSKGSENQADPAMVRRKIVQGRNVCLVCGEPCHAVCIVARVDDGRPPKTPHRWRRVGVVHESCESVFNATPYLFVK